VFTSPNLVFTSPNLRQVFLVLIGLLLVFISPNLVFTSPNLRQVFLVLIHPLFWLSPIVIGPSFSSLSLGPAILICLEGWLFHSNLTKGLILKEWETFFLCLPFNFRMLFADFLFLGLNLPTLFFFSSFRSPNSSILKSPPIFSKPPRFLSAFMPT